MTLKGEAIFQEKLTDGLENNTNNLVNFHASSRKSENLHFDGLLLSIAYEAYNSIYDTDEWSNLWWKTDFLLEKWHEEFGEFSREQSKVWKFARGKIIC